MVTNTTAGNAAKVSSNSKDSIEKISLRAICLGSGGPFCYHMKDVSELCFCDPSFPQSSVGSQCQGGGSWQWRAQAEYKKERAGENYTVL